jgi:hypothetical protein
MRAWVAVLVLAGCFSPTPPSGAPCAANNVCPDPLVCSPATQTCETTAIDPDAAVADAVDAPVDTSDAPKAYLYRRRLTILNGSNTPLPTGFAIRVSLAPTLALMIAQGKANQNGSDVRVIGDTAGERNRILDLPAGPAPQALTFALASPLAAGATTTDYAIYYGAPGATAPPANGAMVFGIYDDFTTVISNAWLKNDAPTVTNGKLVLRAAHTDAITTNAANDGIPIVSAVELVSTIANVNSDPTPTTDGTFYYWFGYQHTGDFSPSDPWALWVARGKGSIGSEQKSPVGCEVSCDGPVVTQNTAAHYYRIERDPTATRFYLDGALSQTATVTNSADYALMIRNFLMTSTVEVDWIRARARVSPDPTVTIAAEEAL